MEIDLAYIQYLAENHEGVDVEFKESTGQLDRGMETLCGMLNGNMVFDSSTYIRLPYSQLPYIRTSKRDNSPCDVLQWGDRTLGQRSLNDI